MFRFILLPCVFLFFASCSPIQTVEGLGQNSTMRTSYISSGDNGRGYYGEDRYRHYNASIVNGGDDPSDIQPNRCGEFHLEDNGAVQFWIAYFTEGKGRATMERFLERSNRYVAMMASILRRYGDHPEVLAYVPLIESGFLSHAQSKKKARGFWQFMSKTAKDYDLRMTRYVDERQDPEIATIGAAKYLSVLCSTFESWPLALAGYNAGQKRISDIIVYSATRNFWELAKKGRLPNETRDYVPQIMAAIKIAQDPRSYGFENLYLDPPMEFQVMKVSKRSYFSGISEKHGYSYEELRELNPMFKTDFIPGTGNSSYIRIPF